MKKITIIACLFIFVFLVLIIITKDRGQDLNIVFVDSLEDKQLESIKTCVRRSDGKLVLVDVEKNSDEDIYLYVLKLYDHYRNTLPLSYSSPLKGNFEIIDVSKNQDSLYIEVKAQYIEEEDFSTFLTALMWTYQSYGINEIEMKVNNEIFHLRKNDVINLEVVTGSLDNSVKQVIYYQNENEVLPVTYIHNDNQVEFLMKKVTSKFNITYTYEVVEENLFLHIEDPEYSLSKNVTDNILLNLESLNTYKNIVIFINGIVVVNN